VNEQVLLHIKLVGTDSIELQTIYTLCNQNESIPNTNTMLRYKYHSSCCHCTFQHSFALHLNQITAMCSRSAYQTAQVTFSSVCAHTHTHKHTDSLTHTHTHTQSHTLTHSHAHAYTSTHSHTQTYTLSHTHNQTH
jgi:hypothetical protein